MFEGLDTLRGNLRCRNILSCFLLRFQSRLRNSCLSFFSDRRCLMSRIDLELGFVSNFCLFYEKLVLCDDYVDWLPNLDFSIFGCLLFIKLIAQFVILELHLNFEVFRRIRFGYKVFKVLKYLCHVIPFLNRVFHHEGLAISTQGLMLFIIPKLLTYLFVLSLFRDQVHLLYLFLPYNLFKK